MTAATNKTTMMTSNKLTPLTVTTQKQEEAGGDQQ